MLLKKELIIYFILKVIYGANQNESFQLYLRDPNNNNLAIHCNTPLNTGIFSIATEYADVFAIIKTDSPATPVSYTEGRSVPNFVAYNVTGSVQSITYPCPTVDANTVLTNGLLGNPNPAFLTFETLQGTYLNTTTSQASTYPYGLIGLGFPPANGTTRTWASQVISQSSSSSTNNAIQLSIPIIDFTGKSSLDNSYQLNGAAWLTLSPNPSSSPTSTTFPVWMNERGIWGIQMTSVVYGGGGVIQSDSDDVRLNWNGFVVIASGTPFIIAPIQIFRSLAYLIFGPSQSIGEVIQDPISGLYSYAISPAPPGGSCVPDQAKNIFLYLTGDSVIGAVPIAVIPGRYVKTNGNVCQFGIVGFDINPGHFISGPAWYLGLTFLQNRQITLNYSTKTIQLLDGVGEVSSLPSQISSCSTDICPIGQTCVFGTCYPPVGLGGFCVTNVSSGLCQPGMTCGKNNSTFNRTCNMPNCLNNYSCPSSSPSYSLPGTICYNDTVCLPPCNAPTGTGIGCPNNSVCSGPGGYCSGPTSCIDDYQCVAGNGSLAGCLSGTCFILPDWNCGGALPNNCPLSVPATCVGLSGPGSAGFCGPDNGNGCGTPCTNNNECQPGLKCDNNYCVTPTCTTSSDCTSYTGGICRNISGQGNYCTTDCSSNSDCFKFGVKCLPTSFCLICV